MDHLINEEPSSCQTFSFPSSSSSCHIDMDVYYTAILRDPSMMGCDNSIPKKTFRLNENSTIMCQRESNPQIDTSLDAKVRIVNNKKQMTKLSADGYQIVANVKFQTLSNNKNTFSLQRFPTQQRAFQDSRSYIRNEKIDLNSTVFYHIKGERISSIENQIITNNDLIKFGKEIYQARIYSQIVGSIKMTDLNEQQKLNPLKVKHSEGECKICLMIDGQFSKDYVISPCKCSGTCSSVHIQCLKNWISQRIEVGKRQDKIQTYDMSRFSCQICKQKYPDSLKVEQSLINISPQKSIPDDVLVLTKLFPYQDAKRISHIIRLQKNTNLTIGRHYYNDLQLQDMSISRNHAYIQRSHNGNFYLYDKNARFGTFISLKNQRSELNEAILLTSKQTYSLKLVEQNLKESNSKDDDSEMTAEKVEQ